MAFGHGFDSRLVHLEKACVLQAFFHAQKEYCEKDIKYTKTRITMKKKKAAKKQLAPEGRWKRGIFYGHFKGSGSG